MQGESVFQVSNEVTSRPTPFKVRSYDAVRRTAMAQREALQNDGLDSFYNLLVERERLLSKVESVNRMAQQARADGLSEAETSGPMTRPALCGNMIRSQVKIGC